MELRLKKIFKLEQKELSKQLSHHTASRGLEDAVSNSGSQGPYQGKKLSESFYSVMFKEMFYIASLTGKDSL